MGNIRNTHLMGYSPYGRQLIGDDLEWVPNYTLPSILFWEDDCYRTQFSLFFLVYFWPNFLYFPYHSFLCCVYLMFFFCSYVSSCSQTRWQGHNLIGVVQVYWLSTSAVGPPHDLLGYWNPKTVPFLFNLILCWNFLSCPRLLPQFKVLDFPDMECK